MISASWRAAARMVFGLVLLLPASRAASPEPFPALDERWKHHLSENFELFSRGTTGEARDLLQHLELMRGTFLQLLELPPRDQAEVTIYAFSSESQFRAYTASNYPRDETYVGEYRGYLDRDVILLTSGMGSDMARWVVHTNYARTLLTSAGGPGPSWLNQGLSMLFGTFEVSGNRVIVGKPDDLRSRLARENWKIDVEQLMRVEEGRSHFRAQEQTNIFHAKAWALLHYWYCGQTDVPQKSVNRFIRFVLENREADENALRTEFQSAFGVDYAEMSKRVSRYMRSARFPPKVLPAPRIPTADTYVTRSMDLLEMRERLAEALLRSKGDAMARLVLLEALNGPRAARAAEVLGSAAATHEGDDRQAQEYWQRAVDAGSTNLAVLRLVAYLNHARWFSRYDFYFRLPVEKAEALRAVLLRWMALSPDSVEPYELLAWVESAAPEPSVGNLNRIQARFPDLRAKSSTVLALALARGRLGELDSAIKLLTDIEQLGPTKAQSGFAEQAREVLEQRREQQRQERAG